MKLFKFLMSLFSQREKDKDFYAPLSVQEIGQMAKAVFTPQPFLEFYCLHKVMRTKKPVKASSTDIKLLVLYHPETKEIMAETAFGIKQENGWIWAPIGEREVYLSSFKSFNYKEIDTYRIYLEDLQNQKRIFAVCKYDKGNVQVVRLMLRDEKKQTATDIQNKICPCDLQTAAQYAALYAANCN